MVKNPLLAQTVASTERLLIPDFLTSLEIRFFTLTTLLVKIDSRPQLVGMFCYALLIAGN